MLHYLIIDNLEVSTSEGSIPLDKKVRIQLTEDYIVP